MDWRNNLTKDEKGALVKISTAALESWRYLPTRDTKFKGLANIVNKPEKHFEEYVSQLIEAMEKIVLSSEARDIVLKQLTFVNAAPTFHSLLKTTKKSGNLFKACVDIVTSYFQGIPISTIWLGQSTIQNLTNQGQKIFNRSGWAWKSYLGKKPGLFSKQCPNKAGGAINFNAPGPTQSRNSTEYLPYLKGYHWCKEVQINFHKNGTALSGATTTGILSNQGNCVRNLPQAPHTIEVI